MKVLGPNQLMEDVIGKGLCVGCGACVNLCPYFVSYRGKTSQVFPCTLESGRCHAHCPKTEVNLQELSQSVFGEPYRGSPMGSYRRVVLSRSRRPAGPIQSGGTVTALIQRALASGLIDAAVLTGREGGMPAPRIVTRPEEVAECAGSKYGAAPTLAAVNQAIREGYKRLGVVGTPCQVTALAMMRKNPTGVADFTDPIALVVGLFCTWALDARDLAALVDKEMGLTSDCRMDLPPPPREVLVVEAGGCKTEIPLEKVRPLVPKGCTICPDMTSEWADVSVGVVEGLPGFNTMIIRTQAGSDAVRDAQKEGILELDRISQKALDRLIWASNTKKQRALIKMESMTLLGTPDSEARAALRVKPEILARILS